jgi:hypothetical protein
MVATSILPPSQAVEIAWGLSNQFSDCRAQLQAEKARIHLDGLIETAKEQGTDQEKRYAAGTQGLIDGALRTLHLIVAGRDLNFKDLDELRDKMRADIAALATLSRSLPSIAPRATTTLFAGSFGGVGLAAFLKWANLKEPDVAVIEGLAVLFAGAVGYFLHHVWIGPCLSRKATRELIKKDYDRTLYYAQYRQFCQWALVSLYERVENWHRAVFDAPAAPETNAEEVAKHVLRGSQPTFCPWVHKHVKKNGWIKPDLWSLCETGGIRLDLVEAYCPVFKKKEKGCWPETPSPCGCSR